jgi:oligopeptidase A
MTITQTADSHKLTLPQFDTKPEAIETQLKALLAAQRDAIAVIADNPEPPTWANTMAKLEVLDDELSQFWSPISHLHGVQNTPPLRQAFDKAIAPLSIFYSEIAHHQGLYQRIQALADGSSYAAMSQAQQQAIKHVLRSFKLAGVHLNDEDKAKYAAISQQLAEKTTAFSNHVLDATQAWHYLSDDVAELDGLPEHVLAIAKATAEKSGQPGWQLSLDAPIYIAVMTYAKNRALRETMYEAYVTRASDVGPNAGTYDNSPLMHEIMTLRHDMAALLGFSNYADYALVTKMANSPQQVINFLEDLLKRAKPKAKEELDALRAFAKEKDGLEDLRPWDVTYYSELMQQDLFGISDALLRPYFSLENVLTGLFDIAHKLYHITISPYQGEFKAWHEDVRTFEIRNATGDLQALFIVDLYARELKRSGAWMDEAISRRQLSEATHQVPIAYLTCNFTPAIKDKPSLLTHQEVITLFHEFGHCLQHMLTEVNVADVAGISGVPWDAVELPSQFMENWAWEKEGLDLFAKHIETNELLPDDWVANMKASKQFQGAMRLCRQLQFALFDMKAHLDFDPSNQSTIQAALNEAKKLAALMPSPEYNRFAHSFSHIFAGGYAAGYYSYLWAELMAADAFDAFLEDGLFNQDHALAFRTYILGAGGSIDADEAYRRFRGRDPKIDGLLKSYGIND